MKFATVTAVLLMIIVCVLLPKLPAIHTWAVEREEERIAEAELAEQKITMSDLTIKNTEAADDTEQRQLRLKLPAGVKGSDITISNDYVTQTVRIELPQTEVSYFENDPLTGSSNHIDNLSYAVSKGSSGLIEITMDQVYELDMDYDENYYYFDFLTPHEVYDKVVVVDAGHGGRAPGATKQGINEKDIDLGIVLQLKEIFDNSDENIGVYYTRTDDSNPTFDQRVQLANKSQADLFISIHNNSTKSGRMSSTHGTQVMYSESDTKELGSKAFAQICLDHVTEALESRNKGLMEGDEIYIIRTSEVPVALIEVGFMTNQEELNLLNSTDYQKKAAEGVYDAVLDAFAKGY